MSYDDVPTLKRRRVSNGNIGFWQGSFECKCCEISLLSTKKRYSSFLKKIFFFQQICFELLKTSKISSDCHIKHVDLSNGALVSTIFWKSLLFLLDLMLNL